MHQPTRWASHVYYGDPVNASVKTETLHTYALFIVGCMLYYVLHFEVGM